MTQNVSPSGKKGNAFVRAIGDLLILALLLAGAGFGGYFWGTHQQMAPVAKVAPGTPGAIPSIFPAKSSGSEAQPAPPPKPTEAASESSGSDKPKGKKKFWISSSGVEYIGYVINVKVNDTSVDNFFGKNVDVTRYVTSGDNSISFEAKEMGSEYNKHKGDASSALVLHLVSGPNLTDNFKPSDVLLTYRRNASEDEGFNNTLHFSGD